MHFLDILDNLNVEVYEQLKYSLEVGKWPDGEPLSKYHQEIVMQSLIAWGETHLDLQERIGYVDKGSKAPNNFRDDTENIPMISVDTESCE